MREKIAVAAVVALIGLIVALSFVDNRTNLPNADFLGADNGETSSQYAERAAASLAQADAPAFALVQFSRQLAPSEAASVLANIRRVNAIIVPEKAPVEIPEPVTGFSRADVFSKYATSLNGVVVYDSGEKLRQLAENPLVATVEAAPADAAWGRLGVRIGFGTAAITTK